MRIIFSDWVIALDKGRLPRQYDDGEPLEVVNAPAGWAWTLNAQMGGSLDVIPLSVSDGVVGTTLSKSQLALAGDYRLQLVGTKDGVTRHTNIIGMAVPVSLSGDATWPTLPTAFSDALDRAEDAADRAESAATHGPRISGTNTWEVWDPDKGQYVDTMVDASGKAGPQGPAGVDGVTPDIQIGTVTTLEPGQDATASIGGTAAEPLLNLGIPKGAKGDKGDGGGGSDISLGLTSATVGQTIKVKAVDDSGRPVEWDTAEMSGGYLEFIQSFQLSPDTKQYELASVSAYRKIKVLIIRPSQNSALGTGNMFVGLKKTDDNAYYYTQVTTNGYSNIYKMFYISASPEVVEATNIAAGNNAKTMNCGLGFGSFISTDGDLDTSIRPILSNIDKCVYHMLFAKPAECIDGEETVFVFGEKR